MWRKALSFINDVKKILKSVKNLCKKHSINIL